MPSATGAQFATAARPTSRESRLTDKNDPSQSDTASTQTGTPPPAPQPPAGAPSETPHAADAIPDEDLDEVEEQPS